MGLVWDEPKLLELWPIRNDGALWDHEGVPSRVVFLGTSATGTELAVASSHVVLGHIHS